MTEEMQIILKKPLTEIENELKKKHNIIAKCSNVKIEDESLIFTFEFDDTSDIPILDDRKSMKHRTKNRLKRNRMKTRGWKIVAKFKNSLGQTVNIYEPFAEALKNKELSRSEQVRATKKILESNENSPSRSSIQYFLDNTLEYLKNSGNGGEYNE